MDESKKITTDAFINQNQNRQKNPETKAMLEKNGQAASDNNRLTLVPRMDSIIDKRDAHELRYSRHTKHKNDLVATEVRDDPTAFILLQKRKSQKVSSLTVRPWQTRICFRTSYGKSKTLPLYNERQVFGTKMSQSFAEEAYLRNGEARLIDSDQETDDETLDLGFAKCMKDLQLINRQKELLGPYLNLTLINNFDFSERLKNVD